MPDIFTKTNDDREANAGLAPPRKLPPPAVPPAAPASAPVDFLKGWTPDERARQAAKLIDLLRNRQP